MKLKKQIIHQIERQAGIVSDVHIATGKSNALTFSMTRETLEDELRRCNDIMIEDGLKLGKLKACVQDLAFLAKEQTDQIERLKFSLNELMLEVLENLRDQGGCDHSVGICACGTVRKLDRARALLDLPPITPNPPDDPKDLGYDAATGENIHGGPPPRFEPRSNPPLQIHQPGEPRDSYDTEDIQDRNPMRQP